MQPQNPDYAQRVQALFDQAGFIAELGIVMTAVEPGVCQTALTLLPKHMQQDGFVHAGVQATLADHTAGGAAGTLIKSNEIVLTVEFKINLLRPAQGDSLRCRAVVLRAGRSITVAESEVYMLNGSSEKLCAKATVTLAVVSDPAQA